MKKMIMALGLMLTVLTLAQCSKDLENQIEPAQKQTISPNLRAEFTPMADANGTRVATTPDGKVSWEANDELTVFIVPAGETPEDWTAYKYYYVTDAENCVNNIFTPDPATIPALTAGTDYDWYVMYPKNTYIKDPLGTSTSGYMNIKNQTQDCSNPTAHLSANDIMTGVVKGRKAVADNTPAISLEHITTLMKFSVKNGESGPITLSDITFETSAGLYIIGGYFVDFENGKLNPENESDPEMDKYMHNTLTLTLKNAAAIAPGGSYDVYCIMQPFTIPANDIFKVTVNSDAGKFEKEYTMGAACTFEAGKMNTATITVVNLTPSTPVIEGTAGDGVYTSNIEFSQDNFVGEKCYLVTYVIDGEEYPGIKLGSGKASAGYKIALNKTGDVTLTIYAFAWNNTSTNLLVQVNNGGTIQGASEAELLLDANSNFKGNKNKFENFVVGSNDFYTINITGATSDTEVILTTEGMSNKRAGFFGVNVK